MKATRDRLNVIRRNLGTLLNTLALKTGMVSRSFVSGRVCDIREVLDETISATYDPDPTPNTTHNMEHPLPTMLYWNWSEGYTGDPDTPDDPPHLEDVTVMLGEHDITSLLPADVLADVREAMLRDMEAGQ